MMKVTVEISEEAVKGLMAMLLDPEYQKEFAGEIVTPDSDYALFGEVVEGALVLEVKQLN
jgi:hypothetical protein